MNAGTGPGPVALGSFLFYFLVVLTLGVVASRYFTRNLADFYLGGRRAGGLIVALSAVVSGRSAWLILAVSGMAFTIGTGAVWSVPGYIVAELFLFVFVGKRLRRFTERAQCLTLPDFFEARFADRSRLLRLASVGIILIFMVAYVAAQFTAGGKALSAGMGVTELQGVWITAIIVLLYTTLGGYMAVALTDVVQALFMILGLVVLPMVAVAHAGGFGAVLAALERIDPALIDPWAGGAAAIAGLWGIGLGSGGNPHILVRYMSIDDPRKLRFSGLVGTAWNVVMGWGAVWAGLAGRALLGGIEALPVADPEYLFPDLAGRFLPEILFGLIIASILAAIMSTGDSQLLVASSALTRDIYQKLAGRERTDRTFVLLSRLSVAALVAVALLLGAVAEEYVFWLVLFAWSGLGASFCPAILLSLYWPRCTRWGVLAGLVTGTVVTFVWDLTPALNAAIYELIPAFFLSAAAVVAVSLVTAAPPGAAEMLRGIAPRYNSAVRGRAG